MTNFTATSKVIDLGNNTASRRVFDANPEAVKWDGAPDTITQTIYSDRLEYHTYCQIKISDRTRLRYHGAKFGGVWGKRCQIRFWNQGTELDGSGDHFGDWTSAVIFDRDQKLNW